MPRPGGWGLAFLRRCRGSDSLGQAGQMSGQAASTHKATRGQAGVRGGGDLGGGPGRCQGRRG